MEVFRWGGEKGRGGIKKSEGGRSWEGGGKRGGGTVGGEVVRSMNENYGWKKVTRLERFGGLRRWDVS